MAEAKIRDMDVSPEGLVYNIEALRNKVRIFFSGIRGEMYFNRETFASLEKNLFKLFSENTADILEIDIENELIQFFPELDDFEVSVSPDYDNREYAINLTLWAPYLNEPISESTSVKSYG